MIDGNRLAARAAARAFLLLSLAAAAVLAQYAGPGGFGGMGGYGSMQPGSMPAGLDRLGLTPWLSLQGTYSTSIPYLNDSGVNKITDAYGGLASAGLSGGHAWSRTILSGYAGGSYNRYWSGADTEGATANGSLGLLHQISPRLSFSASTMFGSTFGGYGSATGYTSYGLGGLLGAAAIRQFGPTGDGAFNDPTVNGVVDNELFANRVTYAGTFMSLRYQASQRWQFGVSGTAYLVGRKNAALTDTQAYSGSGMGSYRISPRTYMSMGYVYGQFAYPRYFGGIRMNQAYLGWGFEPNDRSAFSVYGGASQLNSKYLGSVALDPSIADLLGVSAVYEVQVLKRVGFVGGAQYTYDWGKLGFSSYYNHNIMPGNGALFASEYDQATVGLSWAATDRFSLSAVASYNHATDQIVQGATSQISSGGGYAGYRIGRGFHITGGASYYRTLMANGRNRGRFVSLGVTWSPSSDPIRF